MRTSRVLDLCHKTRPSPFINNMFETENVIIIKKTVSLWWLTIKTRQLMVRYVRIKWEDIKKTIIIHQSGHFRLTHKSPTQPVVMNVPKRWLPVGSFNEFSAKWKKNRYFDSTPKFSVRLAEWLIRNDFRLLFAN